MFNENSVIVKTWVELVRNGTYQKESVPKISNLQEIVWKVLEGKVEQYDVYERQRIGENMGESCTCRNIYFGSGAEAL